MNIKIILGLRQSSITFLFFSGFLLGVVITGLALLGSQIPLKCFDGGNAPDWIAAVGTWVIGYGAWKYAREAHKLRTYEVSSDKIGRIEQRQFALNSIYSRLDVTNFCMKLHAEDTNEDGTAIYGNKLLGTIRTNLAEMNRLVWDEPGDLILDEDIKDGLMALRISREAYFSACKDAEKAFRSRAKEMLSPEEDGLKELLDNADAVATETETLMKQLAVEQERCEEDISALRRGELI